MKKRIILFLCTFILPILAQAQSILIEYELENVNNNRYKYTYTITNDGSLENGASVKLFSIQFNNALYNESTLSIGAGMSSNEWDEKILFSVPGDSAAYDVLANIEGIPSAQSRTGFSVEFDWLGTGLPTGQPLEIYDPVTFELLQSSTTSLLATIQPGDANGDGTINVIDVIAAINMVFNEQSITQGADCNSDGNVNVIDVICLINKVFN